MIPGVLFAIAHCCLPPAAHGQSVDSARTVGAAASPTPFRETRLRWRSLSVVAGVVGGLAVHESGHVITSLLFDARPHLRGVAFHGIPFFAVAHRSGLPRRCEFIISSAGFWMQHAASEGILSAHPRLWRDGRWLETGVVAFGIATSTAYAGAAWARTGPAERDTRGMAVALGVTEPVIGSIVLVPALLDAYRVLHPGAKRSTWASRAVKLGLMLLPFVIAPSPR